MLTSLMPTSPSTRRPRRTRTALFAVVGVAVAVVATQLTASALQTNDEPVASSEELIDRLVELERELPDLPPSEVILAEDETWAEFTGDFTGAQVTIDTLADQARDLFIDANDATPDPVATAVGSAARSILLLQEGYTLLAEWEAYDLAFPVDDTDDEGVATGADEPYGLAEAGLRLVLDAHSRRLAAFELLRDSEAADQDEREFFDVLYRAEVDFDAEMRPDIHHALSLDTTEVIRTIERFGTSAPGAEARARVMTVVCIPREAYAEGDVPLLGLPEELAALASTGAADCPDLPNDSESRLVGP